MLTVCVAPDDMADDEMKFFHICYLKMLNVRTRTRRKSPDAVRSAPLERDGITYGYRERRITAAKTEFSGMLWLFYILA